MRLGAIKPTVFLRNGASGLEQLVHLTIENDTRVEKIVLVSGTNSKYQENLLGAVSEGTSSHDVYLPVPSEPCTATFALRTPDGSVLDERSTPWCCPRHWRVHVVQTSHHDVGYTDLASRVLPQHATFLDEAIDMARDTDGFPEDARFRIVIECAWSLLEFMHRRPPERVQAMFDLLRSGRFELAALFGNMASELCGHETAIRLLYPAFRLKREYGIPLTSAEHNDIPGFSWGLSRVLTDAGIKIFCPGLPLYYSWGGKDLVSFWDEAAVFGRRGPGAFWWEAPTGKRLLFWCNNSGCGGDCQTTLPGLADRLGKLEEEGYPYSVLRWPVLGAARDNSPYVDGYAKTIRQWNDTWAFPHLVCSTNARFHEDLLPQLRGNLLVHRGELSGQDYPVGAMSTARATSANRGNHVRLPVAEMMATVASRSAGLRYPEDQIERAWEDVLWHDEHTWGFHFPASGPAGRAARQEKSVHAHRAAALIDDVAAKALAKIADLIKLDSPGLHVVVFNPLAHPRTDIAEVPLREPDNCGSEIVYVSAADDPQKTGHLRGVPLTDRWHVIPGLDIVEGKFNLIDCDTGKMVPFEIAEIESADDPVPDAPERFGISQGGKRYGMFEIPAGLRRSLRLVATDVPATGYKTYRLVPRHTQSPGTFAQEDPAWQIENEFHRIEWEAPSGDSGAITGIFDKQSGWNLLDVAAPYVFAQLIVRDPRREEEFVSVCGGPPTVSRGHVSDSITWTASARSHPVIRARLTLFHGLNRVDFAVRVLKTPDPLLEVHLAFPFNLTAPRFRYEGSLSLLSPVDDFLPGSHSDRLAVQNWVHLAGDEGSIVWSSIDSPVVSLAHLWRGYVSPAHRCVATDDRNHHPVRGDAMNCGWLFSNLFSNNFGTNFSVSQDGSFLFRYSFASYTGKVPDSGASTFGWKAHVPLEAMFTEHERKRALPQVGSFLEVDNPNVFVLALKRTEDLEGIILRLWNVAPEDQEARITLPHFRPSRVELATMTEEGKGLTIPYGPNSFELKLAAGEVTTIRIV